MRQVLQILMILVVWTTTNLAHAGEPSMEQVKSAVRSILKDPDSAKFTRMSRCRKGFVWGTVNAKNGYGGYTGDNFFVSDGGRFTYVMTPDPADNIVPDAIIQSNCVDEKQP